MVQGQVESDEGVDAAAEHIRRCGTQRGQEAVDIVAVRLDLYALVRVVGRAAREAAAVVGHDGVVVDEMVGDEVEALGIARSTGDQEQDGARAAHLVVEARSRHAQRVDLRCFHLIFHAGFRGYALALGRAPSPVA
jgi:hypothetical protein